MRVGRRRQRGDQKCEGGEIRERGGREKEEGSKSRLVRPFLVGYGGVKGGGPVRMQFIWRLLFGGKE